MQGGIPGIFMATGKVSGEFDYNSSDSVSSQNTSTTTLQESTGIQVNKPAFSDAVGTTYIYDFAGYVLGQNPPNSLDTKTLTDNNGQPLSIQASGPLVTAFVADPTA